MIKTLKSFLVCTGLLVGALCAHAQVALPLTVSNALKDAKIDEQDVSIVVVDAEPSGKIWLLHNEKVMMNPASVIKLVTTYAALDLLGANYTWKTAVFADGELTNGVLNGNLYIRGSGDPAMNTDRMREIMLQVMAAGIHTVKGNLILDRSAYALADVDPSAFDGEPLRPYNVRPDSLMINFKTISFTFNPSLAKPGDAIPIIVNPALSGVKVAPTITVGNQRNCGDWKGAINADFSNPRDIKFNGSFPAVCGSKQLYIAYPDYKNYSLRVVGKLWQQMGGKFTGNIIFGKIPVNAKLIAVGDSKPLAEVVRDINKFSNNVMAQSAFLALSLPDQKKIISTSAITNPATLERSRQIVADWWKKTLPQYTPPVMDNGSGLSRTESICALSLAGLLQSAWKSAIMPEYISSLPIAGVDGTMFRSKAQANAHIKTGSMRNVVARAGYVLSHTGQRRVLVFLVNSPNSGKAQKALDELIDWAASL